jgi:hypothetical protein
MSKSLLAKVGDLKCALEIVLDLCAERDKMDFLPTANEVCSSAKLTIASFLNTLTVQKE